MPEIGGTKLAADFASMMADVRKSIDQSKQVIASAVEELKAEITEGGKAAALAIKKEADTVRAGYAELLGNQPRGESAADAGMFPEKANGSAQEEHHG